MTARYLIFTILMLIESTNAFCQGPPREFFDGLNMINTDEPAAKKDFLIAIEKDSLFHGSYHFLGVIYLNEQKPDSAIWYFKKSIALNNGDVNHTKEMTYVRLVNTYTFNKDFQDAFALGWEAFRLFPDNKAIKSSLRDLCLWSFYINQDHLDPAYLSPEIRNKYVVNSIDEEYLILRNLNVKGEYLVMNSQALAEKKDGPYDVFKCTLSKSKKEVEVDFKINWDVNKYISGKTTPTQPVIDDVKNPVYERVGAMLAADFKTDLQTAIEKILH